MFAFRKILTFVGVTITLAMLTSCASREFETPDLETFANYEDMQRYITSRNQRSMRLIENPTHDSYVNAYNDHHEPSAPPKRKRRAAKDQKSGRKLPSEPQMVKFEIEDAVEPNAEVKEMIRKHRSREEKLIQGNETSGTRTKGSADEVTEKPYNKATTVAPKRSTRATRTRTARSKRPKRAAAQQIPNKPKFNLQIKLIPFEASEAREPDEQTKALIRRMRALELEKMRNNAAIGTPAAPTVVRVQRKATSHTTPHFEAATVAPAFNPTKYYRPKTIKFFMKRKGKRVKRTAPQMIRFEVEDAREPDTATLEHLRLARQNYERSNSQKNHREDKTTVKREALMDAEATEDQTAEQNVQPVREETDEDLSGDESMRTFVYKQAPGIKAKKSIGSLPAEVQKIITHMIKGNGAGSGNGGNGGGAKAYLKYIPAQKMDYSQFKSMHGSKHSLSSSYSIASTGKLYPSPYMKYVPLPQKSTQLQAQIHPVPVVEKIRYIYAPLETASIGLGYMGEAEGAGGSKSGGEKGGSFEGGMMAQPIVVQEGSGDGHATYAADMSHALEENIPMEFRPSKPDPLLNEIKISAQNGGYSGSYEASQQASAEYEKEIQSEELKYKYEIDAGAQPEKKPQLIKIEYHGPADAVKQNFKELPEFKQLSTLVGKSTEDQIHGLTYLLAKEMQNKLKTQRRKSQAAEGKDAQTNTSPIMFPPEEQQGTEEEKEQSQKQAKAMGIQGRLIGMAKSKEYIPIVEQAVPMGEQKAAIAEAAGGGGGGGKGAEAAKQYMSYKMESKVPLPNSFMAYGLSPNYEGMKGGKIAGLTYGGQKGKMLVEQIIHHPPSMKSYKAHGGGLSKDMGMEGEAEQHALGSSSEPNLSFGDELQYASKYAFGYRIRDFGTGNDFGHKQNRDLDGVTRGQYHILLPDGRIQNVIYHADDTGFHADVSFETGH